MGEESVETWLGRGEPSRAELRMKIRSLSTQLGDALRSASHLGEAAEKLLAQLAEEKARLKCEPHLCQYGNHRDYYQIKDALATVTAERDRYRAMLGRHGWPMDDPRWEGM